MTHNPTIPAFLDGLVVDLFAGGGGASTGIQRALGRSPDIAINHSPEAIAMHRANHPTTTHYIENVYKVDPRKVVGGRLVALLWLSPDCTHHSRAKGGKPKNQKIRGLAWAAIPWAQHCRPRVIILENVDEWIHWGPVDRATGQPIKARRGQTYRAWKRKLERLGYVVESRLLRACDYGAPTSRKRRFVVARSDGQTIEWPEATHGKVNGPAQLELGTRPVKPYRTAAEVIDWSIPCPSIFDRERPLADKTMARLARGTRKYACESARPFIIAVNHGGVGRTDLRVHDLDEPMVTVTGGCRGGHALAIPYLVHRSNGERVGQAPRIYDVQRPFGTFVAQGQKHAVSVAFLAKHYSDRDTGGWCGGGSLDAPTGAVTAQDHHALVSVHLTKFYGTSTGSDAREPTPTITGDGQHVGLASAFLVRYNGQSKEQPVSSPIGTLDATDRYGLAEVTLAAEWSPDIERKAHRVYDFMVRHGHDGHWLDHANRVVLVTVGGVQLVVYDIGMRMLTARELFRAQGFPDSYVIDPIGPSGKSLSKTAQIRACGNSVPPDFADAMVSTAFARGM
jgi:DNA (cytosine-5)-methyltransferase 1